MAEAEARPASTSEAPTAETPGVEKVVKVNITGRGWDILKLIGFELEVYVDSKIGRGRFMVNEYSCQPYGVLHGGTTAYVAESVASMLAAFASQFQRVAGVELNVNHLRPAFIGSEILVTASPFLVGKRLQVWEVKFETEKPKVPGAPIDAPPTMALIAVSRVSIMVIPQEDSATKGMLHQQFAGIPGMTFEDKEN